jgi:hypothetical protein
MEIMMDQTNLAVIKNLLSDYPDFSIDNASSEKLCKSDFIQFSVKWPSGSDLPSMLIFKSCQDEGWEGKFYQAVKLSGFSLPTARCLGSQYNSETGQSRIILEDPTSTHSDITDWAEPIPQLAGFKLVEALAELHAASLVHPGFKCLPVTLPDYLSGESRYMDFIGSIRHDFEIFAAGLGNCLDISQCQIYPEMLSLLPAFWKTFWSQRLVKGVLPLLHGNLKPQNVFFPDHAQGKVIFMDWAACRLGLPAGDLAVLLGLNLCPEFDTALPFLIHYHQHLMSFGINGYTLDELIADYEISLTFELFRPIMLYAQNGIHDECTIQNSLTALNSLRDAKF